MVQDDLKLDDEEISKITQNLTSGGEKKFIEAKKALGEDIFPKEQVVNSKPDTINQNVPQRTSLREQFHDVKLRNLRTFQGDAAEAIKREKTSVLDLALAEKKREQERKKTEPQVNPERRKKIITLIVSATLVILGAGSVYFLFTLKKDNMGIVDVTPSENSIIPFNQKTVFDTTQSSREKLLEFLISQRDKLQVNPSEIFYINFIKKNGEVETDIDASEFLNILKINAPSSLLRSFGSRFMFGYYGGSRNEPFLLLSISSFDHTYSGMIKWESLMNDDIGAIFSRYSLPVRDVTGTTTMILNPETESGWSDETIRNKDLRILKNSKGETIILYSFVNKNTLLITSSVEVLKAMIDKILTSTVTR